MEMTISFPGGKKVSAEWQGRTILTDQPLDSGGEGAAPSPYDYFLASLGTCAGFYVLSFCQQRGISTEQITLHQRLEFSAGEDGRKRLGKIAIDIVVPPSFPEKYHHALVRSAEACSVKKVIMSPPEFEITTRVE
jgi:putative redox protein